MLREHVFETAKTIKEDECEIIFISIIMHFLKMQILEVKLLLYKFWQLPVPKRNHFIFLKLCMSF
jgi:hypothetical protein